LRMAVAHRRQANRAIVTEVLFVADADQRLLENQHHRRKHLLTRQTRSLQRRLRALANPRQLPRERQQPAVFHLVADVAPARVIAILLPAARVAPDGLDMPARIRTNPDISPSRWNDQRLDSTEHRRILDRTAAWQHITEPLRRPDPPDTQRGINVYVSKAGNVRRFARRHRRHLRQALPDPLFHPPGAHLLTSQATPLRCARPALSGSRRGCPE